MIEVLRQALDALEDGDYWEKQEAMTSLRQAIAGLESQEPVKVSPLEFVEMVMEKEHLIGKPIFWAEWPNKEKNT